LQRLLEGKEKKSMLLRRRMLRTPWTDRSTNASIIDEVKPKRSLEATQKLGYFRHVMRTNRTLEQDIMIGHNDRTG
jgi:hypothetical protein